MHTDGSAGGSVNGGAGVVIARGGVEDLTVLECLEIPAGVIVSSYQAELYAVLRGLEWLVNRWEMWERVGIVCDSQSVWAKLRRSRGSLGEDLVVRCAEYLSMCCAKGKMVYCVWVFRHCGIVGNELADAAAGRACALDQRGVACLRSSVGFYMKRILRKSEWVHERSAVVYKDGVNERAECGLSREEAVCLARLRSGHCLELGEYRLRVGLCEHGLCRRCNEEVESVGHIWKCAAGAIQRGILGLGGGLGDLCRNPLAALDY